MIEGLFELLIVVEIFKEFLNLLYRIVCEVFGSLFIGLY